MSYKKCTVVMLPTNQKAQIGEYALVYTHSPLKPYWGYGKVVLTEGVVKYTKHHLYILSDDKIEIGDWVLNLNWINELDKNPFILCVERAFANPGWLNSEDCKSCKKIISSTDSSLGLPQPSPEFLQVYCEKQPEEVLVKYIKWHNLRTQDKSKEFGYSPVVTNNQISIKKIQQMYSRERVIEIVKAVQNDSCSCFQHADPESFL